MILTAISVANKIRYADAFNRPFLAITGGHGETWDLGNVKNGIGISMRGMAYVLISDDGRTATIGGGIQSGEVIAALWARGKQAGMIRPLSGFDLSACILASTVY
jgi:FAD/FMN-containing dehydrogenase